MTIMTAPGARRSIPRPKAEPEWDEPERSFVERTVQEYLSLRSLNDKTEARVSAMKRNLMDLLLAEGTEEGDATHPHRSMTFDDEISVGEYTVRGIMRQCRVQQVLDEVAAWALIKEKGLEDTCIETIQVLNEDGLLAANYEKRISDAELKALYSNNESFAFVLVKK